MSEMTDEEAIAVAMLLECTFYSGYGAEQNGYPQRSVL